MRIPPREVRYGGAMIDQKEIDAVVNVMKTGNHLAAREAALIALKADPYGETGRLDYRAAGGSDSRCAKLLGK